MATLKNTVYARRDSATARLRKLGVASKDYNHYIARTDDGFLCKLEEIPPFDADETSPDPKPAVKKPAKPLRKKALKKNSAEPTPKQISIAQFCRERILDGDQNGVIFDAMVEKFGDRVSENQKHYPAWFRCQLRRKGELPPAYDFPNHSKNVSRSEG